ncbi:YitT family protein [Weissella oryzae SG25]|uniref:YitT family protein n=1 Tax=Weissella oryzae (strain DSM 25784 / JCM 18191 / LMG 30913 / SG25) TaxID=1329250 RepID=A0A069CTF0_WEIOS|nr:YitT family protein [Weissella oryzae]GAK30682.1 YitT family protein [Weissella oryzae SG25]
MAKTHLREYSIKVIVFVFSGLLVAMAMNFFYIPNKIFSGGFNGIAQLIALFFHAIFGLNLQVGAIIMAFNIPIAFVGWKWAGREFTVWSFLQNLFSSGLQILLPETSLVHSEPILAGMFGGLLMGIAIGVTFKFGFSTGGMDIVAAAVQKASGKSIGFITLFINAAIVLIAGTFIGWQNAMYTIIGIYITTIAIDSIHTRYQKLTAFIVTKRSSEVAKALQESVVRGITIMPSFGAYTQEPSSTLMMVLSRYELREMELLTKSIDPDAFINVINTVETSNNFLNEDLQSQIRFERVAAQAQLNEALNLDEAAEKFKNN